MSEEKTQTATADPPAESRGLGDTIAKATAALGVKPCGGCKQRQEWLNQHVPYPAGRQKISLIPKR